MIYKYIALIIVSKKNPHRDGREESEEMCTSYEMTKSSIETLSYVMDALYYYNCSDQEMEYNIIKLELTKQKCKISQTLYATSKQQTVEHKEQRHPRQNVASIARVCRSTSKHFCISTPWIWSPSRHWLQRLRR